MLKSDIVGQKNGGRLLLSIPIYNDEFAGEPEPVAFSMGPAGF